ncbi:MAG: DUF488 domain-containing protein [Acidiferrobacterales bacterium]|nr:DUF488 domain-containing protein [Acidiferrobacterales bacterium]
MTAATDGAPMTVHTIGHSNRTLEDFIGLLRLEKLQSVVDVRAYPGSRRHPQFERAHLRHALASSDINYVWKGQSLGGFRKGRLHSPHRALTAESLRTYADHMQTKEFRTAAAQLMALAGTTRLALLCAEKDPSHCHRSMIADYLTAAGFRIIHLVAPGERLDHCLSVFARQQGNELIYDGCEAAQLTLRI